MKKQSRWKPLAVGRSALACCRRSLLGSSITKAGYVIYQRWLTDSRIMFIMHDRKCIWNTIWLSKNVINIYKELLYIFSYICLFLTSRLVDLLSLNIRINIRKIRQLILKTKLFSMNFDTKNATRTHILFFFTVYRNTCVQVDQVLTH